MYHVIITYNIASTEQIDKAKEVIKKLTFEFQSDSFENPGIQNSCCWAGP